MLAVPGDRDRKRIAPGLANCERTNLNNMANDVDRGWAWAVLVSSFIVHIMSYGMAWSTGVYNVIFLDAFRQPKAITAWAGALPTAVMYGIGPISSMLTNKYGFRPVIIAGGVVSGSGLILSYFAPNLWYLYFSFGVLAGAGYGLAYIPSITAISFYFNEKISIAAGIAASGIGLGNFIYPPLSRYLINTFGWQESLLILGAVTLNICVCGAVMRPVRRPEIRENRPILDITPFKKRGYVVLCINNFLFCCGISALYIHLTAYSETKGINADHSAMLISGLGISNLIGRLLFGLVVTHPRFNAIVLYGVSFTLSGVCICAVPLCTNFVGLLSCAVMFGLLSGSLGTLLVVILIELLGLQRFANGYGCLLLFEAAGQLIGGSLTGAMYDIVESYTLAFIIGGVLVMLSGIVMIHPYYYVKNHKSEDDLEEEIPTEKALVSDSIDIPSGHFTSYRDIVQMTASMESLAIVKRICDIKRSTYSLCVPHVTVAEISKHSMDAIPVNKKLLALKSETFSSTETV